MVTLDIDRIAINNVSSIPNTDISTALQCDPTSNRLTFDNKYFTVTTQVLFTETIPEDPVEAVVFVVDNVLVELDKLGEWSEWLDKADPEVRILLVNSSTSAPGFLEWCIEREFELVHYLSDGEDDAGGLLGHSDGMGRVREALECHMWPSRSMKESGSTLTSLLTAPEGHDEEDVKVDGGPAILDGVDDLLGEGNLEDLLNGNGDFNDLFGNLLKLREVANGLPADERRQYAEKVAMSFYSAMGGSSDDEGEER